VIKLKDILNEWYEQDSGPKRWSGSKGLTEYEKSLEEQSCDNKLAGESNAQWRARCGPRPLGAISRGGPVSEGSLKRFKVYVSGEKEPLILMGKDEKDVKKTAHMMIKNSSVKIRKVVKEGKLKEKVVTSDPKVWVPDKFDKYMNKLSMSKIRKLKQWEVIKIGEKFGIKDWYDTLKWVSYNFDIDYGLNEGKLNEKWDSPQPYSSKEAKAVIDGSLKNYANDLRKVQGRVVKDWMSKAKSGVIDYFDLQRGLTTGDISRAHPYETDFLHKVLTKDKIIDRFRKYFGGKKGMKGRTK